MNAKKINVLAIFIAISVIGAFIKIPSFIGSVALDSAPSLIAGALLGGLAGGIVAALGHLVSAYLGGLPLGMLHLFIAVEMFLLVFTFSKIYQTGNSIISILFFVLGNGVILPLPFLYLMGKGLLHFDGSSTADRSCIERHYCPVVNAKAYSFS
ncbi:ECF transporter S component [Niallia circulans]|uniref:ECF transporter S component n=1 Tax=Niallia circulans TaxID=1397 RepID=UPI00203FF0FF|nr:ECF transporter S component [Niallia circulans]MCM2983114.1 ECF transporter S component [Niallia circulans]